MTAIPTGSQQRKTRTARNLNSDNNNRQLPKDNGGRRLWRGCLHLYRGTRHPQKWQLLRFSCREKRYSRTAEEPGPGCDPRCSCVYISSRQKSVLEFLVHMHDTCCTCKAAWASWLLSGGGTSTDLPDRSSLGKTSPLWQKISTHKGLKRTASLIRELKTCADFQGNPPFSSNRRTDYTPTSDDEWKFVYLSGFR